MKVPFLDLKAQLARIDSEVKQAIMEVVDSGAYALGPYVASFEKDFASYNNSLHCAGVNSGTSAVHLALLAAGVKAGDEVITSPMTFVATCWAISYIGAIPVFADIDEEHYTLSPELAANKITSKTKAIIPVHLYGQTADMNKFVSLANDYGLALIEDAAQAHGALYEGKKCGSIGDLGAFSFYPGKNLGAYGEGGAVITNNAAFDELVKYYRVHAQPERYIHTDIGYNYRMDGIQGAVLRTKLKYLDLWNDERRKNAALYNDGLAGLEEVKTPAEAPYTRHIYHVYAIKLKDSSTRQKLIDYLKKAGIDTNLHYPVPVHLQEAYASLHYLQGDFPVTEDAADTLLSLPMYPELTQEMIDYICERIRKFFKN